MIYKLFKGYESNEVLHTVEAKNYVEAINLMRKYVIEQLGKSSMYGFVVKEVDPIEERLSRYKSVPSDLYVTLDDMRAMLNGGEGTGYVSIADESKDYELINKHSLQPAIQLDSNSYSIAFIMK